LSAYIRRVMLKSGKYRYYPIFKWKSLGGYDRKKDAEARLARAISEEAAGYPLHDLLFSEWTERWLPQVNTRVKKSAWESYESAARVHLVPAFGRLYLKELSVADIEDWKTEMSEDGMHPRTFNKTLTILGTCLNDAVTEKKLKENVSKKVRRMKEDNAEMQYLDRDEVRKLLGHDCEIAPLLATAVLSGMREGELLGLKWGDVDLEGKTIRISRSYRKGRFTEPKSRYARRAVSVPPELCAILRPMQGERGELCFPRNGRPWSNSTLLRGHFYPLLEELGMRRIRWHDLRHTYAALMIRLNCPLKWLQVQMGHSSIRVTLDLYGHLLPEVGFGSIEKFSEFLFS